MYLLTCLAATHIVCLKCRHNRLLYREGSMKTINKRHMAWTLTAVVAVMAVLSGCRSRKPTETTAAPAAGKSGAETAGAETTEPAEPALPEEPAGQPEESLKEGNVVCGFTADYL